MTFNESMKLIAVLMATYPNYNPADEELAAKIWADVTEEYSYKQVDTALKNYMRTNTSGFAPVPGQIIDMIHIMTQPRELNEMEAWSLVSKAIRNSGYHSVEEFNKLPPPVQRAVGLPDQLMTWALDEDYNETVVCSNFIRSYREVLLQRKEISKLPSEARRILEKANEGSYLAQIEQKRQGAINSLDDRMKIEDKARNGDADGVPLPDRLKERYKELFEHL